MVFRRRIFVIAVLLIQIGFFVLLIVGSSLSFRYLGWALTVLSLAVCIHVLNKKEKSAYKLTWIFLILMIPIFGGALYILFYSQSNPRWLKRLMERSDREAKPWFFLPRDGLPALAAISSDFLAQARYLEHYTGFPVYAHTRTEYLPSGEAFFERLLEEMEKAERYIFLEFFILRQGKMLGAILSIMEKKARAGLDIRLLYDDLGCFMSLPPDFSRRLENWGIHCTVFNSFRP
ncbi:MAG: PLDc N-terminal domain-containing protein, partial [Treponema sp.]|nr:PLDc N-terminal domain-containing protein [Treponema sp.]